MSITNNSYFYNSWAVDDTTVPAGVILNISVTTTSTYPIYLVKLTINSGEMSLSLSQDDTIVAKGVVKQGAGTVFLETSGSVLQAAVEVGDIKGISFKTKEEIKISDICIQYVGKISTDQRTLKVFQDGIEDYVSLWRDYELLVDNRFSVEYLDGTVTLYLPEEERRMLVAKVVEVLPTTALLTSVNNTPPDSEGVITLHLRNSEAPDLSVDTESGSNAAVIKTGLSPCPSIDVIDDYISPSLPREFSYMPLDDAYDSVTNEGIILYTRNTSVNCRHYADRQNYKEYDYRVSCGSDGNEKATEAFNGWLEGKNGKD